jgi:precorrin-6B methylase 2
LSFEWIKKLKGSCTLEEYKLLYHLVLILKPKKILEIGTARGASSIVMSKALLETGIDGHIYTIEKNETLHKEAIEEVEKYNLENITLLLGDSSTIAREYEDIDFTFVDGDHSFPGLLNDWESIKDTCIYYLFHDANGWDVPNLLSNIMKDPLYSVVRFKYPRSEIWHNNRMLRIFRGACAIVCNNKKVNWREVE